MNAPSEFQTFRYRATGQLYCLLYERPRTARFALLDARGNPTRYTVDVPHDLSPRERERWSRAFANNEARTAPPEYTFSYLFDRTTGGLA